MTIPLIVFVNSSRVQVAPVTPAATALDAVRSWSADAAREVEQGITLVTDSRGLSIPADTPVHSGSILRLVPLRDHSAAARATDPDVDPLR
ncbi:MAG TPA: hypothetical protein VIC55_04855 [Gemmatimonadaceae bacterium]|jgi:hypothetical protein